MKYLALFFFSTVVLSFLGCNQKVSQDGLTHLNPKEFQSLIELEEVQLIDVRKPEEFIEGHIPNAININYYSDDFVSSIDKLDKKKPVYIYCRSGQRSANSASQFKEAGFTQIYNLEGGILKWQSDSLPLNNTN
jgi:rhodanese-related sulfurtransferase